MSYFVLQYDRSAGELITYQELGDDQRNEALRLRLKLEAEREPASNVEIVVLAGETLTSLKRTHARYFHPVDSLLRRGSAAHSSLRPTA